DTGATRGQEPAEIAPQSFTVWMDPKTTTAENVVPRITAAAHGQLAAVCEGAEPGASVRIINPISGADGSVSCASLVDGDGATGEAGAALFDMESDAVLGWTPVGLACGILTVGAGLVAAYALCPHATKPRDKKDCDYVTAGGFTTLSILC